MFEVKDNVSSEEAQAARDLADELGHILNDRRLKNVIVDNAIALLVDQMLAQSGRVGFIANYKDGSSIEFTLHPAPKEKPDENSR